MAHTGYPIWPVRVIVQPVSQRTATPAGCGPVHAERIGPAQQAAHARDPGTDGAHTVAEHIPPEASGESARGRHSRTSVDLDDDQRIAAARRLRVAVGNNATLQTLSVLAAQLMKTASAKISLVTEAHQMVAATWLSPGAVEQQHPREESLSAVTAATGGPLAIRDCRLDDRVRELRLVAEGTAVAFLGVPLFDRHDELVGALCVYDPQPRDWRDMDVTILEELAEAVVSEFERLALAQENETVRLRLDLAMDAAGVGSWEWDRQTDRLTWDERLLRMCGLAPDEFDQTMSGFERVLHPHDRPVVTAALHRTADAGADLDETFRIVRPDTSTRWLSCRGRALHDERGRIVRVIGAASDVTERHEAGQRTATIMSLLELVARASSELADSLEVGAAVETLARLVVPGLADWSLVMLVTEGGALHDVGSWHQDPSLRPVVAGLAADLARHAVLPGALAEVRRSSRPVFVESGGTERAIRVLDSPQALTAVRRLAHESLAVLPLGTDGHVVGLLALARGPGRPPLAGAEAAAAAEVAARATRVLEHARSYDQVRDISEQLQRSLLTEPARPEGIDIAVGYTPASQAAQVGGDWYDAFLQPDGSTMVVVGDVIGHDSASAAAMGHLRSLTRGIAYSTGESPARVLSSVARAIEGLRVDTIATVVLAQLRRDPRTGLTRLTWSSAGHPPMLVVRADGEPVLLESEDLLLGLVAEEPREDHEGILEPGTRLLMFTDGLVERRGEDLSVGLARLCEVVRSGSDLPVASLLRHVQQRMVPREPDDDVALLALEILDPPGVREGQAAGQATGRSVSRSGA